MKKCVSRQSSIRFLYFSIQGMKLSKKSRYSMPPILLGLCALFWALASVAHAQTTDCTTAGNSVFSACYYNNADFTDLKISRSDSIINNDWGDGSPDPGIHPDTFSVRWNGVFSFDNADYTFTATTDDGMKVWIDNTPVMNAFFDQPVTTYTFSQHMTPGVHAIRVDYYEQGGKAVAKFNWAKQGTSGSGTIIPRVCVPNNPGDTQWHTCFYDGQNFDTLKAARLNEPVNYDWGSGSPDPAVNADHFSVAAERYWYAQNGTNTFTLTADDGVRMFIDGQKVLDKWFDQPATTYTVRYPLVLGPGGSSPRLIRIEYYENSGNAVLKFDETHSPVTTTACGDAGTDTFNSCYYNDRNFTGLVLQRNDAQLNGDWGSGSPDPKVPADNFSVRSVGSFNFATDADYAFTAIADDGVRVWVDGKPIIDKFFDQPATSYSAVTHISSGRHTVAVDYYENSGQAVLALQWAQAANTGGGGSTAVCPPFIRYFEGEFDICYYQGVNFDKFLSRSFSRGVNADWGSGSPDAAVPADYFSLRAQATRFFNAGDNTFTVTADDGVRLYVDDQLILDKWIDEPATTYTATKTLTQGEHRIKVEYYERQGQALLKLQTNGSYF
ncbi:MAG: hypothetical protein JWM56_289 [Candidatus Peribacteria bacterium]|nr:hypothetical protein [Candidatus Peribacteria bacterium]